MSTENWSISKPILHGALAAGIFYLGYKTGTYFWVLQLGSNIFSKKVQRVAKSYCAEDPVKLYCVDHSTPLNEIQQKLMTDTLKHPKVALIYFHSLRTVLPEYFS